MNKINTVIRYLLANEEVDRGRLLEELKAIVDQENAPYEDEMVVRNILMELGVPDHLLGYAMAVEGILLCMDDNTYIRYICNKLYPELGKRFDSTPSRVERSLRHMIEVTWVRGDVDAIEKYFGATVDPSKGKPTNSEFIARITNAAKMQIAMS